MSGGLPGYSAAAAFFLKQRTSRHAVVPQRWRCRQEAGRTITSGSGSASTVGWSFPIGPTQLAVQNYKTLRLHERAGGSSWLPPAVCLSAANSVVLLELQYVSRAGIYSEVVFIAPETYLHLVYGNPMFVFQKALMDVALRCSRHRTERNLYSLVP